MTDEDFHDERGEPGAGRAGDPSETGRATPAGGADPGRRRRLATVAVLLAASALALWASSRLTWATLGAGDGLGPPRNFTVHGSDWSPWLTPLALALVAAIAAAVAVKGWLLRAVALIVAIIGVLSVIPAISMLTGGGDTVYAAKAIDLPGRYTVVSIDHTPTSAVLVLVGGAIAVFAGVLLLRSTRVATGISTKYTSPAARRAELEKQVFAERDRAASARDAQDDPDGPTERMLWDAQDTGADPTSQTPSSASPAAERTRGSDASDGPSGREEDHT